MRCLKLFNHMKLYCEHMINIEKRHCEKLEIKFDQSEIIEIYEYFIALIDSYIEWYKEKDKSISQ